MLLPWTAFGPGGGALPGGVDVFRLLDGLLGLGEGGGAAGLGGDRGASRRCRIRVRSRWWPRPGARRLSGPTCGWRARVSSRGTMRLRAGVGGDRLRVASAPPGQPPGGEERSDGPNGLNLTTQWTFGNRCRSDVLRACAQTVVFTAGRTCGANWSPAWGAGRRPAPRSPVVGGRQQRHLGHRSGAHRRRPGCLWTQRTRHANRTRPGAHRGAPVPSRSVRPLLRATLLDRWPFRRKLNVLVIVPVVVVGVLLGVGAYGQVEQARDADRTAQLVRDSEQVTTADQRHPGRAPAGAAAGRGAGVGPARRGPAVDHRLPPDAAGHRRAGHRRALRVRCGAAEGGGPGPRLRRRPRRAARQGRAGLGPRRRVSTPRTPPRSAT